MGPGHRAAHGPLSCYRNLPEDPVILESYAGTRLAVSACFIGGEYDVATWWGSESTARAEEVIAGYRGETVFPGCGHWIQQERPGETNRLLVEVPAGLK